MILPDVLNASRHHRKNRILRHLDRRHLRRVLNASRHHRKNRCAHLIHWEYTCLQSRLRAPPPFFGFSAVQAETEIGDFLFSSYLTGRYTTRRHLALPPLRLISSVGGLLAGMLRFLPKHKLRCLRLFLNGFERLR